MTRPTDEIKLYESFVVLESAEGPVLSESVMLPDYTNAHRATRKEAIDYAWNKTVEHMRRDSKYLADLAVLSEELWVEVTDYPNYVVSSRGVVMSRRSGRKLTPTRNKDGHLRVTLAEDGRVRQIYVRRLVAQAFHPEYREGAIVKNQNGDITDNSIGNIYVRGTDPKPIRYRRQGARGKRVRVPELDMEFVSVRAAARFIGGDYSNIYRCLRGHRDKHLGYSFEYIEETE